MTDKEKLIQVLEEIGVDYVLCADNYADKIYIRNEQYDVEDSGFLLKFDKVTGKYFE